MPLNTDFKTKFNGGTRGNRFIITGNIPGYGSFSAHHVRATQIPELPAKTIIYDHQGRKHYYPGEKSYGNWSFTVLDDTVGTITSNGTSTAIGSDLWKAFHNWQNSINTHTTNTSANPNGSYKADGWSIQHLNINGDETVPLKEFKLYGCWPITVNGISFNMSRPSTPSDFSVIISFDMIQLVSNGTYITTTT